PRRERFRSPHLQLDGLPLAGPDYLDFVVRGISQAAHEARREVRIERDRVDLRIVPSGLACVDRHPRLGHEVQPESERIAMLIMNGELPAREEAIRTGNQHLAR